jgi:DegV family protein with EDD domain
MTDKISIITDSVACIPQVLVEEYKIEVIPIHVIFNGESYRDGVDLSPDQFYTMLRKSKKLPTTAASLPGSILEAYQKLSQDTNNILFITLSTKFSGMYNSAIVAADMAKEVCKNVEITVIDSQTAAAAEGLIVLAAARAAYAGKDMNEVIRITHETMEKVNLYAALDTLYYLVKGGRAPKIAALTSSMLKIKPILTIHHGEAFPLTNPRTTTGAIKRFLELMKNKIIPGEPLHVAVMHADALDKAILLRDEISARFDLYTG